MILFKTLCKRMIRNPKKKLNKRRVLGVLIFAEIMIRLSVSHKNKRKMEQAKSFEDTDLINRYCVSILFFFLMLINIPKHLLVLQALKCKPTIR